MSKIRFINPKGKIVWLNEIQANKPQFIKRHKLTKDVIEEPVVKMDKKAESVIEKKVVANVITDLKEAKEKYKELHNKKPHHTWGIDVLNQKINLKLHGEN